MQWVELSLCTTEEAVDWIGTLLATVNYSGEVCVTDYQQRDQNNSRQSEIDLELQLDSQPDWTFTIYLHLPYDANARTRVEEIARLLEPLHRTELTSALKATVVTEKTIKPSRLSCNIHRIGQRFVVLTPDALYQSAPGEVVLQLGKSLAFGSGLHPATIVTLQLLERYLLPTMNTLDLGSGSGILSVAMAKLGAQVLALDNDSMAVQSTQDAVDRNAVRQQVTVQAGSLGRGSELGHWMGGAIADVPALQPTGTFDLIAANILARVHTALAPDFQRALRRTDASGGILITAGFTADYKDDVSAAFAAVGLDAIDCQSQGEWVALAHQLKA